MTTHTLEKIRSSNGFRQTVEYSGSLANKPTGWRPVSQGKESTYTLTRKDPKTGFIQTIEYSGALSQKPKGWHLVKN